MPGSSDFLKDLNQPKVYELKKAFCLFDLDGDGVISEEDVRNTFLTLGVEKSDAEIIKMFEGECCWRRVGKPVYFDAC
ncbi:myosin light chain 2V [Culex quinquefasciatus]|uniref:Myosin light chain 2V n=1 Tax=Culex quinquefasciatus TaxID=7176 RepID=B0W6A4_CULQU|nr:myosin light chain 2V [Culex quinquefasciatus]|eukprot:XP_001844238.1 myosin light chain 2V [Culex quinquefasciatus]